MKHLLTSEAGLDHFIETLAPGEYAIHTRQTAVDDILEHNKAQATHNDGYTPSREMKRVASIPLWLIHKWKVEEGWDAFNPGHAHKLAQKLNSSDYAWLRTAPGTVAALQDGGLR